MVDPELQVVVVNYNAGEHLALGVGSLLESTFPLAITVVDNHSSDESIAQLRNQVGAPKHLSIYLQDQNLGFSKAVNLGASHSTSPYIGLLNPDALVHPDSFKKMVSILKEDPKAGLVGGLVFEESGFEQPGCRRREPTPVRGLLKSLGLGRIMGGNQLDMTRSPLPSRPLPVDAVSGSFMVIRRSLFEQLGGLDERYFLHVEDLDLCRQVRKTGAKVIFLPTASIIHSQGVSGRGLPIRVERYKHQGMITYQKKFNRGLTNALLLPLLATAIWLRFLLKSIKLLISASLSREQGGPHSSIDTLARYQLSRKSSSPRRVLVTGATSLVGRYLLPRLRNAGFEVLAISRQFRPELDSPGITWYSAEFLEKVPVDEFFRVEAVFHLAPIWTLQRLLGRYRLLGCSRLIGFSSMSAITKERSNHHYERDLARSLIEGEQQALDYCKNNKMSVTLFRPTLIYGGREGNSVGLIRRSIRRIGLFPMVGRGSGKRQPVHAEDLADAALNALELESVDGKIVTLSGGEVLSYRQMISRLFQCEGKPPRFIPIPVRLMRGVLTLVSWLPNKRFLTPEMANRMNQDLDADCSEANELMNFNPRPFRPC